MNSVLLSGDDAPELKELGRYLGKRGYEVFLCSTKELLEIASRVRPDAIIYDGKLEEKLDLSAGPGDRERIPVIVIVDEDALHLVSQSRDIDDFVLKPLRPEELEPRVRMLLWRTSRWEGENVIKVGKWL